MRAVIIGGGVAGLSAAHMLVHRGISVEVYEKLPIPGGKARSMRVPGTNLPGEHGFRFLPGFYKHLPATMREIPLRGGGTVYDNLVSALSVGITQVDRPSVFVPARFPESWQEVRAVLTILAYWSDIGLTGAELRKFAFKLINVSSMCRERRSVELEGLSWMDYIDAANSSPQYEKLLCRGLTRALVALRAERGSTRTVADILIQLFRYMIIPGTQGDRLLNRPTDEAWIFPWADYLDPPDGQSAFPGGATVAITRNAEATEILFDGRRVTGVRIQVGGEDRVVTGDYYLVSVPVDAAHRLFEASQQLDPVRDSGSTPLANIGRLDIEWMNGVQYYIGAPWADSYGQTIHPDSEWSLTTVSQRQFWKGFDFGALSGGAIQGVISVDVSDWEAHGSTIDKPAKECTKEEIRTEVWSQLCAGRPELHDVPVLEFHVDPDIVFPTAEHSPEAIDLLAKLREPASAATHLEARAQATAHDEIPDDLDSEPLLVNTVNSWQYRPEAATVVPNLFLAADYVRTFADLATMEGANEAARRAVNGVLDAERSIEPRLPIWMPTEGILLAPLRAADLARLRAGKPHWELRWLWYPLLTVIGVGLGAVGLLARVFIKRPGSLGLHGADPR